MSCKFSKGIYNPVRFEESQLSIQRLLSGWLKMAAFPSHADLWIVSVKEIPEIKTLLLRIISNINLVSMTSYVWHPKALTYDTEKSLILLIISSKTVDTPKPILPNE